MSLELGFYGKLPEFPDFIKSDNASQQVASLHKWLDLSFDRLYKQLGDNARESFEALPPLSFVVRLPDDPQAVVCLWKPSHDTSGRRSPFTIYAADSSNIYDQHPAALPEAFSKFLSVGRRFLEEGNNHFSFNSQRDSLWALRDGIPVNADQPQVKTASALKSESLKGFAEALKADDDSPVTPDLVRNVFVGLTPLRNNLPENFHALFRFPLSGISQRSQMEIAFWVCLTQTVLGGQLGGRPLLWTDNHAHIAFGLPDERLLASVLLPDEDDDSLWDFGSMNLQGDLVEKELYEKFQAAHGDLSCDLLSFVKAVGEIF